MTTRSSPIYPVVHPTIVIPAHSFGEALRQARKQVGMTQGEFADAVGYSFSYICNLEKEQRLPDPNVVQKKFIPALGLQEESRGAQQLLALAHATRGQRAPSEIKTVNRSYRPLPYLIPSLLGRAREVNNVCDLILSQEKHCVTLFGPPGIGKTTLGLAVANRLFTNFEDGVYFVSLAAVSDPNRLASTIASALNLSEGFTSNRSDQQRLVEYLRHKRVLLVLDNFEQLITAATHLIDMLNECSDLYLLITSRSALRIRLEQRFHVMALALPAATQLFIERVQAIEPNFTVAGETEAAIQQICQRLDCLPLAIELVASQITLFTPNELLSRLTEQRLDLLHNDAPDLETRHRTLRRAIQHSYELLTPQEQTFFRTLGIFSGGFELSAIEAIWQAQTSEEHPAATLLSMLVNKSLVQSETLRNNQKWFQLLETVRDYALEELKQHGEFEAVRGHHALYFCSLAEDSYRETFGPDELAWHERIARNCNNFRAILTWSLLGQTAIAPQELAYGLSIAGDLLRFWYMRGHFQEAYRWTQLALTKSKGRTDIFRAKALHSAWLFMWVRNDPNLRETVHATIDESILLWRELNHPWHLAINLLLGSVSSATLEIARQRLNEAKQLFQEINWQYGIAWAHGFEHTFSQPNVQHIPIEESVRMMREIGSPGGLAITLFCLAQKRYYAKEYEQARIYIEESIAIYRKLDEKWILGSALILLGDALYALGQRDSLAEIYAESIAIAEVTDDNRAIANSRERLDLLERGEPIDKPYWIIPPEYAKREITR